MTVSEVCRLTLEENRLPDVGADGCHGVQVGETLLVLLGDGQQSPHIPDLTIDVVPSGFGCSFGWSVRDHDRWGQKLKENWGELKSSKPELSTIATLSFQKLCLKSLSSMERAWREKKVIGLKWSSLFFTIQPGVSSPRAEADFEYQGFLWKLLIWEAAVSAAEMRALSRLCLCDQYLSGPIHREPGVFIAARVSAWASHTKERLGWASAAPFIAL